MQIIFKASNAKISTKTEEMNVEWSSQQADKISSRELAFR